ncbi:MAG TPA: hypothetical protein VMF58_11840 [Rhizomicrobium sp.]|nr:hypothetical protein [Rhizomicrobium sp.]
MKSFKAIILLGALIVLASCNKESAPKAATSGSACDGLPSKEKIGDALAQLNGKKAADFSIACGGMAFIAGSVAAVWYQDTRGGPLQARYLIHTTDGEWIMLRNEQQPAWFVMIK